MGIFALIERGFGGAISWMLKNPIVMLLAIFAAMFIMIVVSKNAELKEVRSEKAAAEASIIRLRDALTTSRNNVAVLGDGLKMQNVAILGLQSQGVAAGQKFDRLMSAMAASDATIAKKIGIIDKAKPGADHCVSALEILKGAAQ